MKKHSFLQVGIWLLFILAAPLACVKAGTDSATQSGYWNIETNRLTRDYTIVRFYSDQHQLVYEEELPNCDFDLSRPRRYRRFKSQLDAALQRVLNAPASGLNAHLLAGQLGARH